MLINDFFTISEINASSEKLIANIELNAKHKIFDGHFPDNPVTPGVVQLQMVKEILEYHFKKDLQLKTISKCKFLNILNPVNTPSIAVIIDLLMVDGTIKVNAVGEKEQTAYFKFSAIYQ